MLNVTGPLLLFNIEIPFWVYVAVGLIVIALILIVLSKSLPRSFLAPIGAALVGVLGVLIFQKRRRDQIDKEIEQKKEELKEKEKKVEEAEIADDEAVKKLREGQAQRAEERRQIEQDRAQIDQQLQENAAREAGFQERDQQIEAEKDKVRKEADAERERIKNLSAEEKFDELARRGKDQSDDS